MISMSHLEQEQKFHHVNLFSNSHIAQNIKISIHSSGNAHQANRDKDSV